jgi:hypothetical protein
MMSSLLHEQESLMYTVYFAPRGKTRILNLGHLLAQRYLSATDRLIGFIGDAGSGKSLLIRGMFPGLELTNDDEGVNVRPLPLLDGADRGFYSGHTYHLDVRFEAAFHALPLLADAAANAVRNGKRVVVEHFDMLYPALGMNAEVLVGIGEEVILTRPNLFGPLPKDIADIVYPSIRYRKMVHTAEDLACKVLEEQYGFPHGQQHGDVRHGFVLRFAEKPRLDIAALEEAVREYIRQDLAVGFLDDATIRIGESDRFHCTGPRIHVQRTGEIENFRLVKECQFDPISGQHELVGLVGPERSRDIGDLNRLSF